MNLHPVAQAVKSYGRGPDSMLVHMSPREVGGLQALAMANGGSLTINPETGLPEAGFLDKLLPAIIGFALGPAGFALMSPVAAGLTVGGIQALRTGDLGKGISAGLGAWGGAGIGAGLSTVGGMAAENTVNAAAAQSAEYAGLADAFGGSAGATVTPAQLSAAKEVLASPWNSAVSGAKAAMSDPSKLISAMGGGKNALMAAGAAAAPILADQAVQAGMPTTTTTSKIRRFTYDPYSQTYSPAGVYPAAQPTYGAEGGIMNLRRGGVARLAEGGIASFADGGFTDAQVAAYLQDNNLTGAAAFQAANVFGVPEDQLARAQSLMQNDTTGSIQAANDAYAASVAGRPDLIAQNQAFYNPTTGTGIGWDRMSELDKAQSVFGVTDAQVERAQKLLATDPNAYKGAQADYLSLVADRPELHAENLAFFDPRTDSGIGQQHLDPRSASADWNKLFTDEQVLAYMIDAGLISLPEVKKIEEGIRTGNTQGRGTQGGERDITNQPTDKIPQGAGGSSGAGQIGGGTVINPNGTITTSPRIPGIPVGGFTGAANMRDVYTAGGGRLGGVTQGMTPAQLAAKYQTSGDSKAAYDYLMGKGPYPTRTTAPEIYRPYTDIIGTTSPVGSTTRKYIFNQNTGTYSLNPDYREPFWVEGERILRPPVKDIDAAFTAAAAAPGVGDAALQAMLDAGQFTIQEIADRLGISLEDAKKRFKITTEEAKKVNEEYSADGSGISGGDDSDDVGGESPGGEEGGGLGGGVGTSASATAGAVVAKGGLMSLAKGGLAQGSFVVPADVLSAAGNGSTKAGLAAINDKLMKKGVGRASLISGNGDGLSDSIPTSIEGVKPARVADGEAYIDPRTVKRLGGGDAKKGAAKLYAMMDRIRKQAHGKTTQQRPVNMAKAFA